MTATPPSDDVRARRQPDSDAGAGARRRDVLRSFGCGAAGLAARSVLAGAVGGALAGLAAAPAEADAALDVQILQTASSIEKLAIDAYDSLLTPGTAPNTAVQAIEPAGARAAVMTFVATTRKQHADHLRAFQAQTATLGGVAQDAANARFQQAVSGQLSAIGDLQGLVDAAIGLEELLTDTYLSNLTALADRRTKEIVGGVLGAEAQHLATLRAFTALLATPDLIALPFPQAGIVRVPAAVCNGAFPDALHRLNGPDGIADPTSGAVR
ncbi:MAG TPA: ferritin-like domain-containing protein [Acidimicrobiales bacterium]|jgi:hypothetical protein|nr:ferritin-like domain-containing protein [Acidimicrobiales bacterium]